MRSCNQVMLITLLAVCCCSWLQQLAHASSLIDWQRQLLVSQNNHKKQLGFEYTRSDLSEEDVTTYELTRWAVAKYRAILQGISEGLYQDANRIVAERCMTGDTVDAIFNVVEGFRRGQGTLDTSLKVITAAYILTVNLNENC